MVPDAVVIGMVDSYFDRHKEARGFLFDGFPRTVAQASALDKLLHDKKTDIKVLLALDVTEEEIVRRLLNRGITSGRSDDTSEEVIRKRFAVYIRETSPVAEHYKQLNKLQSIKGEGSVDEIFNSITEVIDSRMFAN